MGSEIQNQKSKSINRQSMGAWRLQSAATGSV
jgi:hypothetical protein